MECWLEVPSTTRLRQGQAILYFPRHVKSATKREVQSIKLDNLRSRSLTPPGDAHLRDESKRRALVTWFVT
jgi:hypothetical protein